MVVDKDMVGAFISGICLIHCLTGPFLILLGITSLGHAHSIEQAFHYMILAPILILAAWSIPKGLKKHHRKLPAMLSVIGMVFLMLGLIVIKLSLLLTIMGSVSLFVAHLYNRKLLNGLNR